MTNLLKSIFISVYVTLLILVSVHACVGLWESGVMSGWMGVAIAVWPMMFFFVRLFLSDVVRTSPKLGVFQLFTWGGFVLTLALGWKGETLTLQLAYSVCVGVLGTALYVYWYSHLPREDAKFLVPGETLPVFELEDESGNTISSDVFVGQPSLLIFYRGNWCPLCMAQIKEVAGQYKALADLGATVALISPQPHENTRGLAEKFKVPFKFLVDVDNKAAKILGIDAENGTPKGMEVLGYDTDTVMPTVLITDKDGVIIFADLTDNYRVRPEPETFIEVLKQHGLTQ